MYRHHALATALNTHHTQTPTQSTTHSPAQAHAGANVDALRLLGALAPELPAARVERHAAAFKEACGKHPNDAALHELAGELLAASDPKGALEAFEAALRIHRGRQAAAAAAAAAADPAAAAAKAAARVPPRLLNNTAVLRFRAGRAAEALELFQEALEGAAAAAGAGGSGSGSGSGDGGEGGDGAGGALGPLAMVTLGFNAARAKEAAGDGRGAAAEYERLLEK